MKKAIFAVTVGLLITQNFTSCKKDYTCECTWKDNNGEKVTVESKIGKTTKKDAKAGCEKIPAHYSFTGVSCFVK